tara:strand:+ start:68 stop:205 length:138 start_codon:yes stop_codon:yes gene_type:complete
MKRNENFIRGVLVGIIITLMTMMFFGFSSGLGHNKFNPVYVKVVE